jgi:hydroxymethylpyrimidine pyrophosphatase-like HAD family hydrolase
MAEPLSTQEMTGPVRALFSDVDGTLTTNGRIEPETYAALATLEAAGVTVVLVTGRPAGWGQALLSLMPVAAVVTENGGVTFVRVPGTGGHGGAIKRYGLPVPDLAGWRQRMHAAVAEVQRSVPAARLSSDSRYREVDLAIDWNEEASLSLEEAQQVTAILRGAGLRAVRSSVHVNFCPPVFDKLSACLEVVRDVLGGSSDDLAPYVYVGDSLNDAPMFGGFPRSVGVANVRAWWDELPARPRYVTAAAEGAGLREVIAHVLALGRAPA